MFSDYYEIACEEVSEYSRSSHDVSTGSLRCGIASDFAPFFWSEGFGLGGEMDQAIIARSAAVKSGLYGGRVFVIVPIYVTSICEEQCLYCNFRGGNKGIEVQRRRLTDDELEREATYLVEERGLRVLELVYATDPRMRVDTMCRHVELLRRILERHGGGLVGISAEQLEESEYRRLVNAGLCWSVLWQETYDKARYAVLHPGRTKKANFEHRLNAYERMLAAEVFSRSHQLSDLPDMSQIVHGPLMQHLLQGDFAGLLVPRAAFTGASRQGPQILHVGLALLFKMVEGIFRIGIAVQLQVHLRIIRLELRQFLTHEPVHACSIAVALGMGKMREHFRYRKAVGRGLPFGIFDRQVAHQSAQDRRGRFQLVEAV